MKCLLDISDLEELLVWVSNPVLNNPWHNSRVKIASKHEILIFISSGRGILGLDARTKCPEAKLCCVD